MTKVSKAKEMENKLLVRALNFAIKAHGSQIDRGKKPYLLHPLHVMSQVEPFEAKLVAILHDVLEDSEIVSDDLCFAGFSQEVVSAVVALTKTKGETRMEAAKRARENPLARLVKIADVMHNMDTRRLVEVKQKDLDRLAEYKQVYDYLLS